MSRLNTLSPAALKAMFAQDADDSLIVLLVLTGNGILQPIRIADSYTHKFEYLTASSMTITTLATGAQASYTYLASDAVVQEAINADQYNAIYGVVSNSVPYVFIPFEMNLPSEEQSALPRASITIHDVTRMLLPVVRNITQAANTAISLVLTSTPSVVEIEYDGFLLGSISYQDDTISGELTVESMASEPFPVDSFTPSQFPGLF